MRPLEHKSLQHELEAFDQKLDLLLNKPILLEIPVPEFRHFEVPSRHINDFVGRENELDRIHAACISKEGQKERIVVIRGLGGQGKTQLALKYCRRTRDAPFPVTLWIDANSQQTVKQSLEAFSERLGLSDSKADRVVCAIGSWTHPWLMVFDNHDDPDSFNNIQDFIPESDHGAVIITTRNAAVSRCAIKANRIELSGLDEDDALHLLLTQSEADKPDDDAVSHARAITERLGWHPLALTQASSYILQQQLHFFEFLTHYDRRRKAILSQNFEGTQYRRKLKTDDEKETALSVFTTWELSLEQLQKRNPMDDTMTDLLTLFAFFDCKDISEDLFRQYTLRPSADKIEVPRHFWNAFLDKESGEWDRPSFVQILTELAKYSLVQTFIRNNDDNFFHLSLHPLVQDWIKLRETKEASQHGTLLAADILGCSLQAYWQMDGFYVNRRFKHKLLPHVNIHMTDYRHFLVDLTRLRLKGETVMLVCGVHRHMACLLLAVGRYSDSTELIQLSLQEAESVIGKEHPFTLASMMLLAVSLGHQGKHADAESIGRGVLRVRRKRLGRGHPDTLVSMSQIASALCKQGQYDAAAKMEQHVLLLRTKVSGKKDPMIMTAIGSLANYISKQGNHDEAEEMQREALARGIEVFGPEHSVTLFSKDRLAEILAGQEKYDMAKKMFEEVFQVRRELLGQEHPDTLRSMSNVAVALCEQKEYGEAEGLGREVLSLRTSVLGRSHPATLYTMRYLSRIMWHRGKSADGNKMITEMLSLQAITKAGNIPVPY